MDQLPFAHQIAAIQMAPTIVSMAVGLVFAYAAASKLLDIRSFVAGIRSYDMIPDRIAPLAGGVLIVGESCIALAHFGRVGLQFVVPGTIALLSMFFMVTAALLKHGEDRPCLCFGAGRDDRIDLYSLARILLLLLAELALYLYSQAIDGQAGLGTKSEYGTIESLAIAAVTVALVSWSLAIPKVRRAWRVVRS